MTFEEFSDGKPTWEMDSRDIWDAAYQAGRDETSKELSAMRELAAGRCSSPAVAAVLGPLSLWSKDAFDKALDRAFQAGRDAMREECQQECSAEADEYGVAQRISKSIGELK